MMISRRVGFSLSRALFRKKCVGPSPGAADFIFPGKKLATFFSHHCLSAVSSAVSPLFFSPEKLATFFCSSLSLLFILLVHSSVAHYFRHAKYLPLLLWGPLFCGGPCSAKHAEHA